MDRVASSAEQAFPSNEFHPDFHGEGKVGSVVISEEQKFGRTQQLFFHFICEADSNCRIYLELCPCYLFVRTKNLTKIMLS